MSKSKHLYIFIIESFVFTVISGNYSENSLVYPKASIFALCTNEKVCYQLSLIWGVTPILVKPYSNTDKMIHDTGDLLKGKGYLEKGDLFIITAGVSAGVTGSTNMLKIHEVE